MFDFLKRNKTKIPEAYKDLINDKDYSEFLGKCLTALKELNVQVESFENGDITYQNQDGEEAHYYLDNLLRKYVQLEGEGKDEEIKTHFRKLQDKSSLYNYLFKDFDYAKQFLKVLVKPTDIAPNFEDFISRADYPNLATFLVFDFEEQFYYIHKEKAIEWQVSNRELFEVAIGNIANEEVEVKEYVFGDKFTVYIMFSGDFSASYTLLLDENLEFAIGTYGCLIAIPTKGTAFLHPIETKDVLDLIEILYPQIENFYHEDPGNISLDYYWFYRGQFYLLDRTFNKDSTVTINLPTRLNELFRCE